MVTGLAGVKLTVERNAIFFGSILQVVDPWRVLTFMANYPVSSTIIAKLKLRTGYLNTTEVMEILRRSRNTLCAWVKAGDIPALRMGRDNMFDPLELAHWLEERQLGQHAAVS
jgi:hypothetical protein